MFSLWSYTAVDSEIFIVVLHSRGFSCFHCGPTQPWILWLLLWSYISADSEVFIMVLFSHGFCDFHC